MSTDQRFSLSTRIRRSAADVFAWHEQPGALDRLCPPWERVEVVRAEGGVRDGARVVVRNKFGPVWMTWEVEHRDYIPGRQFRDVQLSGPFARWEHLHRVEPDGPASCVLTDEIVYRLPAGMLGNLAASAMTRKRLDQLFNWRHQTTRADLEMISPTPHVPKKRILLAGGSGMIGTSLTPLLQTQGFEVVRLVRRAAKSASEVSWTPERGEWDRNALGQIDGIINLSGENVGEGRWTEARRAAIFRSRTDATRTVVSMIQQMKRKPEVLVNASAVGYYGDRGAEVLTEQSSIGQGFLPEVCLAWETHADGARKAGVRTAILRFGVVLSPAGGALAKLLPVFRSGVGGPIGDGEQWMSWISIADAVNALHHALVSSTCSGVMNAAAPHPVSNSEFTKTLGRVLSRPTVFRVPRFALRTLYGEMADGTILASTRAVPERLLATGFNFRHPDIETALRAVLGKQIIAA